MSKVWLITGSASGLGRNIAEAVLAMGDPLSPRLVIRAAWKISCKNTAIKFAPLPWTSPMKKRPKPPCSSPYTHSGVSTSS